MGCSASTSQTTEHNAPRSSTKEENQACSAEQVDDHSCPKPPEDNTSSGDNKVATPANKEERREQEEGEPSMEPVNITDVVVKTDESWRNCKVKFEHLHNSPTYKWWEVIDELCTRRVPEIKPQLKRRGWKTIRLFVSSTFKDMHSEREFLVKRLFPELRIWCEERKIRFIDIDLRWGVPKDADSRETLLTCLSEIDRCYEENEFPYFLNMLSERYGWVPARDDVDPDVREKYKWLPQLSVTAMEIATGSYWALNPNAIFMFRKQDFLSSCTDQQIKKVYIGNEEEQTSLDILKSKLREKFPNQVFDYGCKVDGNNGQILHLSDLDEFGERVVSHLKAAIERQYPADGLGEDLTSLEVQHLEHEAYMIQRSQILYGREGVLAEVMEYIQGQGQKSLTPLVLVGSPGAGKSAVIAYIAKSCLSLGKKSNNIKTFYHFVGATPGSTDLYRLLSRLWGELLPGETPPSDFSELKRSLDTVFSKASGLAKQAGVDRLIVLIDALNQMDDEGGAHELLWLPRQLPDNVRVVVSTLPGRCLDALRNDATPNHEVAVNALGVEHRMAVVNGFLGEYNKKLDANQMDELVNKPDAGSPLYLSAACEDLRVFGSFRKLDQKISQISPNLTGLLTQILKRIEDENGKELVIATLSLIETSRFGLLETELLELLSIEPTLPKGPKKQNSFGIETQRIPPAMWALVYLGLRQYLRPSGGSGEGRLDFHHRTISKSVRSLYLQSQATRLLWNTRLAEYFWSCPDVERRAEELPYHLEVIGDTERMKECLLDRSVFQRLYSEDRKSQLLTYWRAAGGYDVAATESVKKLQEEIQRSNITSLGEIVDMTVELCWFIIDLGEYKTAEEQLEEAIARIEGQEGNECRLLCDVLYPLVHLYFVQAIKVVYNTSPVYARAMNKGRSYTERCVQLHQKYFAENDLQLGKVLLTCGYFQARQLEDAKTIFKKHNFNEGLAEVLYNLAEKSQYHSDINVPKRMFEESLELCKGVFGYYSAKTARCYQLFGQLHWNQSISGNSDPTLMDTCLELYKHELAILEALLGMTHPTVVRSREDVIIILQTLRREPEAAVLLKQQPADKEV